MKTSRKVFEGQRVGDYWIKISIVTTDKTE